MIRRAIAFLLVFGILQFGWQALDGSAVARFIIERGVVAPAVGVAQWLTPGLGVHASGNRLSEPTGALAIVNGCDGMETLFLLVAGFCVAPLPVRSRLAGILVGTPIVYILNQLRILALFYARHRSGDLFDVLHAIVTPIVMIFAIAAFYYYWLHHDRRPPAATISA
jgi:exosortase family protein XrtM